MLTDIFATRYASVKIWKTLEEPQRRLIVQGFRLVEEQVCPFYINGHESTEGKEFWTDVHARLSMELGLKSLSPLAYSYTSTWQGKASNVTGVWSIIKVCENWMLSPFDGSIAADRFIKERISFVEICFRKRHEIINKLNAELPARIKAAKLRPVNTSGFRLPGDPAEGIKASNSALNVVFQASTNELNARFRQADCNLHYHNGFIQISDDELLASKIEEPFWSLLADAKWKNVDTDIKEAMDIRDTNGRDPAFFAARALESAIKIISDEKGWTHGGENGAHNYIDNLASKKATLIADWESRALKSFFTEVRNPLGHGPGNDPIHILSYQQTNWAIETCMTWIKSLILRM